MNMKTNRMIIGLAIVLVCTSCISKKYGTITRVDRDGSLYREIHTITSDSILSELFPYPLSSGWEITQTDTVVNKYGSPKNEKFVKISRKFKSMDELSSGLRCDMIFPVPKESLKKRFRWFYTYYAYTATYPEVTDKGSVPMDQYLNKAEQKFYLQGDLSAYRGMTGMELKEELDDIEARFMEWYAQTMYEENLGVILHFAETDFRLKLPAAKDSVYSMNEKQMKDIPSLSDVCTMLDRYFSTNHFSKVYAENEQEMNNMLDERTKVTNQLMEYEILYELTLPGKIMTSHAAVQNEGTLTWKINLFKFLADDYILSAESRAVNIWAFAVTLLLIVFSGYCFSRVFK